MRIMIEMKMYVMFIRFHLYKILSSAKLYRMNMITTTTALSTTALQSQLIVAFLSQLSNHYSLTTALEPRLDHHLIHSFPLIIYADIVTIYGYIFLYNIKLWNNKHEIFNWIICKRFLENVNIGQIVIDASPDTIKVHN